MKPIVRVAAVKGWLKRNWVPLVCITIAVAGILLVLLLFIRPCVPTPQALVVRCLALFGFRFHAADLSRFDSTLRSYAGEPPVQPKLRLRVG